MMRQGIGRDVVGAIEALLFVSDEPVSLSTLSDMLDMEEEDVLSALAVLRERLADACSGIMLREVAEGWRLCTHPRYHELLERYVASQDTRRLSRAALETLAVIAYCQPATRALVASVRGVNSDSPIGSLVEKGLVKEAGKDLESPGQPTLYVTSKAFLEKFGLNSIGELPPIERFAPDEESRRLIEERLGMARFRADESEALPRRDDGGFGFSSDFYEVSTDDVVSRITKG